MKPVTPDVSFPKIEHQILEQWQKDSIFEKQNEARKHAKEFNFYDGPPFANGLPHYGHLLANTIKDTVPRYWVMRGFHVDRRFGWDCHGLPVEYEVEKTENLKGRPDILKMGVSQFNEICRSSVQHYTGEWQKTITRLGRWVDWHNQYRTMDKDFMESVWWVFSELHKKGLIYRGFKVVPYSPRTTSVVSNFEANQNYKETQDPAITVKFKIEGKQEYLLAWTTTPWTLISNLALCVHPEVDYVKIKDKQHDEIYYLAEARLNDLYKPSGKKKNKEDSEKPYEILETLKGDKLHRVRYEPLFSYFKDHKNAFQVLTDAYVTTDDGTGIVHQAPAYGEDDFRVCQKAAIDLVDPVDENGLFTDKIELFRGEYVKEADKNIIKHLKEEGKILRHDTLVHSYPFCERTDTPLIYKAIPAWYVAVEKFVDKLVDNNEKINWVPSHLKEGRMGNWLKNARDWAISRNRFWGTPIPVFVCDKDDNCYDVIGSVAELEEKTGQKIDDLHKHFISELSYSCQKCGGMMKPVEEVFDCWFESGAMPYAQMHYPFEHGDRFENIFPADFIAEGLDQTRGWFYTLSVLSTALFDKPAFKNVVVNGVILDETGRKMSKRHRNYTPPVDLIEKFGADSVRLYMLNSQLLKAEDLIFTDTGVKDVTRAVLLPLWNAYSFLSTYADADGWQPGEDLIKGGLPASDNEFDKWILSRLQSLKATVTEHMEDYKLYLVVPRVVDFIEDLTNWYIRLSRRRFWGQSKDGGVSKEQKEAYSTLFFALYEFSKVFAPFAPFLSDKIYQNLSDGSTHAKESVHLCDMPEFDQSLQDIKLEQRMSLVRRATNLGRSLRQKHKIKTRQVLPSMMIITRHEEDRKAIENGTAIIKQELNVKEILFTTEEAAHVRLSLKPNFKSLGRKLGKKMSQFKKTLDQLNESHEEVSKLLEKLESGDTVNFLEIDMTSEDFEITRGPKDDRLIATEKGVTVLLDVTLTDELVAEGIAREVINRIQNLRKDSGLNVSDRIKLQVLGPEKLALAVKEHGNYVSGETLAEDLKVMAGGGDLDLKFIGNFEIEGMSCAISLEKI